MVELKAPRGTIDRFPPLSERYQYVIDSFLAASRLHGYRLVHTPTFEEMQLFSRGVGESTDIVMKEMYSFQDKGGRELALRPEMTAGVIRALIETKRQYHGQVEKLAYYGPMFRYDRPQKGRYREFFQVGIEAIGENSPYVDADVILTGWDYLLKCGIDEKEMVILINSVGDASDRVAYLKVLREHLKKSISELCDDCRERIEANTLRVFDCKAKGCRELIKNAPRVIDHINDLNRKHFDSVLRILDSCRIKYRIVKELVRGLDYYTHTVFEIFPIGEEEAAQGALIGGGRYDGLFANLSDGKLDFPAVGFASGVERVADAVNWSKKDVDALPKLDFYFVVLDIEAMDEAFRIARMLQTWGYIADVDYHGGKIKSQFKRSEDAGAKSIMIIGNEELKRQIIKWKPSKDQEIELPLSIFDNISNKDKFEKLTNLK